MQREKKFIKHSLNRGVLFLCPKLKGGKQMDSERKGMGLLSWMTLLFVGAKLFGFINWSWWLVLIPV